MAKKKKMSYKEALDCIAKCMSEVKLCPPGKCYVECTTADGCEACWQRWRAENVDESVMDKLSRVGGNGMEETE